MYKSVGEALAYIFVDFSINIVYYLFYCHF